MLGQEQTGYREGYSIIDHVFVLYVDIELYKSAHKRIYCAFIDYWKTINWQKLLSYGINGNMFTVVNINMIRLNLVNEI